MSRFCITSYNGSNHARVVFNVEESHLRVSLDQCVPGKNCEELGRGDFKTPLTKEAKLSLYSWVLGIAPDHLTSVEDLLTMADTKANERWGVHILDTDED